jgi:uncharacterized protein (TIGR01244 family)
MKKAIIAVSGVILAETVSLVVFGQSGRGRLDQIEQALKADVPKILCVDESVATAGQPVDAAFGKLAANGFRSVMNLRTASEGIDLERERGLAEAAGMRYVSIPVVSSAPKPEQVDAFIKAVKDPSNHPMLIHCASANRVGAFWMIYRAVEQNWPEEKALEEATRIGLSSPTLKTFAHEQIVGRKK